MSHTWRNRKHLYTSYVVEKKNNRHRYITYYKYRYHYIQIHRAFSAHYHNSEEPGIRPRLLPPDPWEDINNYLCEYLKPQCHSRLERHRAARKAAVREMDARLICPDAA